MHSKALARSGIFEECERMAATLQKCTFLKHTVAFFSQKRVDRDLAVAGSRRPLEHVAHARFARPHGASEGPTNIRGCSNPVALRAPRCVKTPGNAGIRQPIRRTLADGRLSALAPDVSLEVVAALVIAQRSMTRPHKAYMESQSQDL